MTKTKDPHDLIRANARRAELDRCLYRLAKEHLLGLDRRITPELLGKCSSPGSRPKTLANIYRRILGAAHGAGMKPRVIRKHIKGGLDDFKLKRALCGFDPVRILRKYRGGAREVLRKIQELNPDHRIHKTKGAIWPLFCRTILTAARFLVEFGSASAFYKWADSFDRDERLRYELPKHLSDRIDGIGFALACDFIKEVGYVNFGKPDTQIKQVFSAVGLSSGGSDRKILADICRIARNTGQTPYHVDKIFWLIGSGKFPGLKINSHKEDFIHHAKEKLAEKDAAP